MLNKSFFLIVFLLCFAVFLTAQDVPVDPTLGKGYLLGPGDEIVGKVLGEKDYDFQATVNEDGKIEVPFYDKPITARCRTERELRNEINDILKRELKNPQLSLRVTERKSRPPASISGEVNSPQQVILMRKVTLIEMLGFAGGLKEEAGGSIQVFRSQAPVCAEAGEDSDWRAGTDATDVPSRIYNLANVKIGKEDSNPIIYPGDVVVVQKAPPVYIVGEVVAPQGIYLKEGGLSLSEAIAKIGGVNRQAKTKNITIRRIKPGAKNGEVELISANYDLIKKGQQKDIMLQPYDIVEVDKAKESIAATVLKLALGAGRSVITSGATNVGYRVIY
jgi:polysaccharide export outer membrane protein